MIRRGLLLLFFSLFFCAQAQEGNDVFDVKYEYQMDVNPAGSAPTIQEGIAQLETDVKTNLDAFVGQVSNPPVAILGISSSVEADAPCEPSVENWICAIVQSSVRVEILNQAGEDVIELATVERVQFFIDDFNDAHEGSIVVTFIGPFFVSAEIVIELSPVSGELDDTAIAVLEGEVYEILEPALLEGGITLETAEFLYQELTTLDSNRRGLQQVFGFRNSVHMYVTGRCRGCTDADMSQLADDAVDENSDQLRENLQTEGPPAGTDYFDSVETLSVSAAQAPATPPPLPADYDADIDNDDYPYWLWVVLGVGLGLLLIALFGMLYRNHQRTKQQHVGGYYGDDPPPVNSNAVFGMNEYDTPENPADSQHQPYLDKPHNTEYSDEPPAIIDNPTRSTEIVYAVEPIAEPNNVFSHEEDDHDNVFRMP